jgi:hypothetical protein
MNEDIIKWAREAGIDEFGSLDERLIFFAALVRADEREACAKVCEDAAKAATTVQQGPADDLANIMLRHHALAHTNDADAIRERSQA